VPSPKAARRRRRGALILPVTGNYGGATLPPPRSAEPVRSSGDLRPLELPKSSAPSVSAPPDGGLPGFRREEALSQAPAGADPGPQEPKNLWRGLPRRRFDGATRLLRLLRTGVLAGATPSPLSRSRQAAPYALRPGAAGPARPPMERGASPRDARCERKSFVKCVPAPRRDRSSVAVVEGDLDGRPDRALSVIPACRQDLGGRLSPLRPAVGS